MTTVAVPTSLDEIAQDMTDKINIILSDIDEISKVNPNVQLRFVQDSKEGLVAIADISFPETRHLSPMEFTERLIATELIKVVVRNHYSK